MRDAHAKQKKQSTVFWIGWCSLCGVYGHAERTKPKVYLHTCMDIRGPGKTKAVRAMLIRRP